MVYRSAKLAKILLFIIFHIPLVSTNEFLIKFKQFLSQSYVVYTPTDQIINNDNDKVTQRFRLYNVELVEYEKQNVSYSDINDEIIPR